MKKQWVVIVGAIIVIAGIGIAAVLLGSNNGKENQARNTTASGSHGKAGHLGKKNACDYLTESAARELLGGDTEKGTANADASSDDINVSTCTYTSKAATLAEIQAMRAASLLVRAPLTEAGAASNETPFGNRPNGAQDVKGYGQQAYWDATMGQLNVLKDNTWLIVSYGKSQPSDRTLAETKKLADIVVPAYK